MNCSWHILCSQTWETAFTHMLSSLESTNVSIAEVWSLDIVNQGDSAVLNADHLGYTCKLFTSSILKVYSMKTSI